MDILLKIKSFFKKPQFAETSSHLPERSEGREMNKVQRTPSRSPSLRETKAKVGEETKFLRPASSRSALAETSFHLAPRSASRSSVIEDALAVIALGLAIDLNLVEISQALRNYCSRPGKKRNGNGRDCRGN